MIETWAHLGRHTTLVSSRPEWDVYWEETHPSFTRGWEDDLHKRLAKLQAATDSIEKYRWDIEDY